MKKYLTPKMIILFLAVGLLGDKLNLWGRLSALLPKK